MQNLLKFIEKKDKIILCLILGIAFLVRIVGIGWYSPYTYYHDEYHTVGRALNLITPDGANLFFSPQAMEDNGVLRYFLRERKGYFSPHSFGYPPLYVYIQAFFYKIYFLFGLLIGSFHSIKDVGLTKVFLVGRFVGLLFGMGTVFLVYLIGKRMYSKKVGLLSSLFLSFVFLHILYSKIIKPDIVMSFFIILSFLFIYFIYEKGKLRDYILASIFMGFSVATKYGGIVLIVPLFLAHLFNGLEKKRRLISIFFDKKVLLLCFFAVSGFFIACPYAISRFPELLVTIKRILDYLTQSKGLRPDGWLFYLTVSLNRGMGLLLELFSFAGIIYGIIHHRKRDILLFSFPLIYFLLVGSFYEYGDRYILYIIPFLAIFAAMFVDAVVSRISSSSKKKSFIAFALIIIILIFPVMKITRYLYLLTQKGTLFQAKEWIEQNIPEGSTIALENYCPPVSFKKYNVYQPGRIGIAPFNWYKSRGYNYIIISSFMYERYLKSESDYRKQNYLNIIENGKLIKEFRSPYFYGYSYPYNPNPTIKIYEASDTPPYFRAQFPGNFEWYSQRIALKRIDKGWMFKSSISCGKSRIKGEYIENPYVRIADLEEREIAKLIVHQGRIEESPSNFRESSVFLTSLPPHYKLYIGYECKYESDSTSRNPLREIELKFGDEFCLPREDYSIEFAHRRMPPLNAAEYDQAIAIFKSKKKNILWSKIFGGELVKGDDYVLNPYVKLVDSKEKEVAKLFIYKGKVGGKVSPHGPQESSINIKLPLEYKLYIGYEYYYDASHKEKAGGPLEIEIGKR